MALHSLCLVDGWIGHVSAAARPAPKSAEAQLAAALVSVRFSCARVTLLVTPMVAGLLKQGIEVWGTYAPKLAAWAEANLPDGFTVFNFPAARRVRLRTTNRLGADQP